MRLGDLARLAGVIRARVVRPDFELNRLHNDSRRVDSGTAFYALRGLRTDGHRFVEQAVAAGAPALFVSDAAVYDRWAGALPATVAGLFQVAPGRRALAGWAAEVFGHPARQLRLHGVTGTNGKTTATHLFQQLLGALGRSCGVLGTAGWRIGEETVRGAHTTPEAADIEAFLRKCVDRNAGRVVMEVSSHGLALDRVYGCPFAAAVFTNLSQDHLDHHGNLRAYRDTKFRLFLEYDTAAAVINRDDAAGRALEECLVRSRPERPRLTFALERAAELTVRDLRLGASGTEGELCHGGASVPFALPLAGRYNVSNLLAAVGLLLAAGEELPALAEAAARCTGAPGRFERVALDAPFTVVVDYAHTPDALENLLAAARALTAGRVRVLFGCGGERDRGKRPLMGAVAGRLADEVVLSDDNPRGEEPLHILAQIRAGLGGATPCRTIPDRREAIFALLDSARAGDTVVLAGKGDEDYQETAGRKLPFQDRQVVIDWARTRRRVR